MELNIGTRPHYITALLLSILTVRRRVKGLKLENKGGECEEQEWSVRGVRVESERGVRVESERSKSGE